MLNELLLKRQHCTNANKLHKQSSAGMAFSNPEYMCFNELNTFLRQTHSTKPATWIPIRKNHRLVPLPPPARPPPPPPISIPPALPPKLYQNLPIASEQIHIECYDPRQPNFSRPSSNLLKINDTTSSLNHTDSTYSSMIILQSCSNTASDSSSATMIIRNSPPEPLFVNKPKLPVRSAILSPIMTSSRADLHKNQTQAFKNVIDTLNESILINQRHEDSTRDNQDGFFKNITRSLPFKRVGNHQRQRRLSFSDTLDILTEQHLTNELTEHTNQTNENTSSQTLTLKSFSNFNYDMYLKRQHRSFTPSTSSLSESSSMSSMILQPTSPQKEQINLLKQLQQQQTPSKSNIKSATIQKEKQVKKVSFMLTDNALLSTSDYEDVDNVILRSDTCTSISSSSSTSSLELQHQDKIIFANNDYFINLHNQLEPSSSSSSSRFSSSSSSSTCSSSSSSSSGYKSINVSNKLSPTDLNIFIQSNQDRLERLRQKRAELILAKNTNKLAEILDYTEAEQTYERNNCNLMKDISAKLFQTLHINKTSTLPRRNACIE